MVRGVSSLHWQRLASVVVLVGALVPFSAGVSAASQGGDDHQVTICHRTNAENNPYVEITVDKAALFKRGHDTHDEGGVHQPGDKANGVRWGDIVPAFDYYASPQDETAGTVSHYAGLNNTAEGLAILEAGCEVPDENPPEPSGSIDADCLEGAFIVSGVLDDDGGANVAFRLTLSDATTVGLAGTTSFEETLAAAPGTTVTLQAKVGDGAWTDVDGPVAVADCEQPQTTDTGKLTFKKDMEGDPIGASTDFTVRVDCPGTTYDQDVPLNAENTWVNTTGAIPTGTTCQVVEVKIPTGWNPEGITLPDGTFFPEKTPADVTVGSGTPNEVSAIFHNDRRTGRVSITKVVEGDATGLSFTVRLDCDGPDYDETAVLSAANNWTVTYRGIPSGITCHVTEPTVPDGWTLKSIAPDTFQIDSFATIPVVVTNARNTGVISVTKQLDGAANGASTTFTFDVDCPGTTFDQVVVVTVTSGTSATATTGQIPTGLTCTVTERSTPGWTQTGVVPAGGVVAVGSTVTFTNQRLQGTLGITKAVSPVAGGGTVVSFGDKLTYTLTVSATGNLTQPNVVVTDYVPGFDPARPTSGTTTYVPGSAACVGSGTCTVTGPDAAGLITWSLGDMAGGTTRQVTFQVIIDDVTGAPGEVVAVDIINAGAVRSTLTPTTPSNEVVTPVTKTFPVKIGQPGPLPKTGTTLPLGPTVGTAFGLVALGLLLALVGREASEVAPTHRSGYPK